MVKPAPVQKRPLEIIYNPYPTSCSKFCNHPIDRDLRQEYKDVIRKAKEGVVSTGGAERKRDVENEYLIIYAQKDLIFTIHNKKCSI